MRRLLTQYSWLDLLYAVPGILMGVFAGVGFYTFIYAKGYSYLSNDPAVCMNCHVMRDQHEGWVKSSHRTAAVCNDCHTPHNLAGKYMTKARNGFWHSYYFTMGGFHEPIRIKSRNRRIAEENCRRCHQDVVMAMDGPHQPDRKLACIACHGSVGHQ